MAEFNVAWFLGLLDSVVGVSSTVFLYGLLAEGGVNGPFLFRITLYCLITCAIYKLNNGSLASESWWIWKYSKDRLLSRFCLK